MPKRGFFLLLVFFSILPVFGKAEAAVSACTASVSPDSVGVSSTTNFIINVENTDSSAYTWIKIARPSSDFILRAHSVSGFTVSTFSESEAILIEVGRLHQERQLLVDKCHFVSNVIDQDESLRNEGSIFTPVTPYPINYHSITPREEECSNLLVPVCVSASHVAYSSLRMEPVYMILGQSAATAASIAIDENVSVQKVPYGLLGHYLIKDGQNISLPGKGK